MILEKICEHERHRISRIVFEIDYHNLSPHSWSSEIKTVMTDLQLLNNFENKSAVHLKCAKLNVYDLHPVTCDTNCEIFTEAYQKTIQERV